jgi:5-enolpyruvylshikimate-3-phosphate synthase
VKVLAHRTLFITTGNAGTAMRPLAGVLCAGKGNFVLDGTPRMRERPIDDLVDGLLQVRMIQLDVTQEPLQCIISQLIFLTAQLSSYFEL